jgi:hypothetical protein
MAPAQQHLGGAGDVLVVVEDQDGGGAWDHADRWGWVQGAF